MFLALVKSAVVSHGFVLLNRDKNLAFITRVGLSIQEVEHIICSLSVSNYCSGPDADSSGGKKRDVWVFGVSPDSAEVYIKLSLAGEESNSVICISFHESERPLDYPFGDNDENG
jgi:hypothetical protein